MTGRTSFAKLRAGLSPVQRVAADARTAALFNELSAGTQGTATEPARFVIEQDASEAWHWQLVASGNQVLAVSAGGFQSRDACLAAVGSLVETVGTFDVKIA